MDVDRVRAPGARPRTFLAPWRQRSSASRTADGGPRQRLSTALCSFGNGRRPALADVDAARSAAAGAAVVQSISIVSSRCEGVPARGKRGASTVLKFALLLPLSFRIAGVGRILVRSSNGGNVQLHMRAMCRSQRCDMSLPARRPAVCDSLEVAGNRIFIFMMTHSTSLARPVPSGRLARKHGVLL